MDFLEQVLNERAGELADALTWVGFSRAEARRFLDRAAPELVESYRWQAEHHRGVEPEGGLASELLAGMRGKTLAREMGLPVEKTWAGLRELVPAVLQAHAEVARSAAGGTAEGRDAGAEVERSRLSIGFGLMVTRPPPPNTFGRLPVGATHPILGRLLAE